MSLGPAILLARRCIAGKGGVPGEAKNRYLRGAILGVALSLVPLVVVLVVADGMIEGITSRYIETGSYHLQAQPLIRAGESELEERAQALRTVPGLRGAFAEMQGAAVALLGNRSAGAALRAVDPLFLQDTGTLEYLRTIEGSSALESSNEILLGEALARKLGAHPGDIISIVTARSGSGAAGLGLMPKVSAFRLKGIVSAGYRELDSLWAFVNPKAGAKLLSPDNSTVLVGMKVDAPFGDLEKARASAKGALPIDWIVSTWPESNRNLYSSFTTTRSLLLLVMALAVAVASVNVGSAL
ncbi:MAG: ABC transporter permease, partial [Spirochaetaceae bacterium]|nr:ABC transporter permease [Spirochaetaceae bacterium]